VEGGYATVTEHLDAPLTCEVDLDAMLGQLFNAK